MATYVKGDAVENATSYELLEKSADGSYSSLATAEEINFEVSALGLAAGDHTLVVRAKATGYANSPYSNEVIFTVEAGQVVVTNSYSDLNGYIALADGAETESASWGHSDLLAITALTNGADGYCTSVLQGHAKVANVAYFSANDLTSYISGVAQEAGAVKQFTVEEIQASAPEGAAYVAFSTHSGKLPLTVTVLQ